MNKIEQLMKHHTDGGRMIRHYNGEKEYILKKEDMNEILEIVKKCSISDVSNNEVAVCPECQSKNLTIKFYDCNKCDHTFEV